MCGIAAVIGGTQPLSERLTRNLMRDMAHRGPDGSGQSNAPGLSLGHRRLSIIDLSDASAQPMTTPDGRYSIIYNGELYNYPQLREQLLRGGHALNSRGDTEVLLTGLILRGPAFLRDVHGMFAFVFWDHFANRGWLGRDVFGIKPLYYAQTSAGFMVASEVAAIRNSGLLEGKLDRAAVESYLAFGAVSEPHVILEGICMLPAGTTRTVALMKNSVELGEPVRFLPDWPARSEVTCDPHRADVLIRDALFHAVERHLVSDVPVGVFLSGGIDSSAIVAAAHANGRPLETFTITFSEADYSEAQHAAAIAKRFGTNHHEVPLSASALLGNLPAAFRAMDQPTSDGLNTFSVAGAIREFNIKVALSGLGGDELFAGYPSFRRALRATQVYAAPQLLRRAAAWGFGRGRSIRTEKLSGFLSSPSPATAAYHASRLMFGPRQLSALLGRPAVVPVQTPPDGLSLLDQVSWLELNNYMRNTLLRDSDVFSMAHGLELRVPFLDREMLAAATSISDRLRLHDGASKPALVHALHDLLPEAIWNRPKRGFTLPFDRWLRNELQSAVSAVITTENCSRVGIAYAGAREVWSEFLTSRPGYNWSRPWTLYTLLRWAREKDVFLPEEPRAA